MKAHNSALPSRDSSQSGQIAVVILLITVVLMTAGLSLVTRTTQEIYLSQQEAESARVFNAAEAGVEEALSQQFDTISVPVTAEPDVNVTDASVSYTITPMDLVETTVLQGDVATVELEGSNPNDLTIEWGNDGDTPCNNASLILTAYYDDAGTTRVYNKAIAPRGCPSRTITDLVPTADDYFEEAPLSGSGSYVSRYSLVLNDFALGVGTFPLMVRIRPVYFNAPLKVTGASLPVQQHVIRSTGTNDIGNEQRVIEVQRGVTGAPSIMDFALYSGAGILKP